jgi:hypothetical protein
MKLLAIPLDCQRTTTKWLVIGRQKTTAKSLVMRTAMTALLKDSKSSFANSKLRFLATPKLRFHPFAPCPDDARYGS